MVFKLGLGIGLLYMFCSMVYSHTIFFTIATFDMDIPLGLCSIYIPSISELALAFIYTTSPWN